MYTELEIKSSSGRAYVEYYFDGERQREYNANKLSLSIYPNKAKSPEDKLRLLEKLKYEFKKALEKGWNPLQHQDSFPKKVLTIELSIHNILNEKLSGGYSRTYKRDLKSLADKFLEFLTRDEKKRTSEQLEPKRITDFLNTFNSSNRNYMNKRQNLNVLLPGTLLKTNKKKCKEKLNECYKSEEIKPILNYLKARYPKLHLIALLAYGCFLRPHEESRHLKKKHITSQKIYLSGDENKGQKVRVVNIPGYVYKEMLPFLEACVDDNSYLFTGSDWLLNNDYFKTQWSRAKKNLIEKNLINENQTLYSFRHTAAINVYRKCKDLHLLQQMLGHSDMIVTLKYLRGLGEIDIEHLKHAMPEL